MNSSNRMKSQKFATFTKKKFEHQNTNDINYRKVKKHCH